MKHLSVLTAATTRRRMCTVADFLCLSGTHSLAVSGGASGGRYVQCSRSRRFAVRSISGYPSHQFALSVGRTGRKYLSYGRSGRSRW